MSDAETPEPGRIASITAALLAWIGAARRDLPWRRPPPAGLFASAPLAGAPPAGERDPYAVWVSEIMLQQTQVATVIPYYERWLARFPDIERLAAAPLDEVLKAWEGLGYYSRARHLHETAQRVLAEHGGRLPDERQALLRLPGIGRYTAGAILSLAFGQPEPVLDGNVRRVLCRLYDIAEDPRAPAVEERLWALAREAVEAAGPGWAGDLNEALMELGALVCTPAAPGCPACPIAQHCLANERGTQAERPAPPRRPQAPHYDAVAAVVRNAEGHYLLARRPLRGLLAGLWEFPGDRAARAGSGAQADLAGLLASLVWRKLGIRVTVEPAPFVSVKHAYTHFRITLHAFRCELAGPLAELQPVEYTTARWVAPAEFKELALPVTDQKIADALRS